MLSASRSLYGLVSMTSHPMGHKKSATRSARSAQARRDAGWPAWRLARLDDSKALADALAAGDCPQRPNPAGQTPLMLAALHLRLDAVRTLIPLVEVGARSPCGKTALMYAAWSGGWDCVRELLAAGSAPGDVDVDGWTPAMFAAASGSAQCALALSALSDPLASDSGGRRASALARAHPELAASLACVERCAEERQGLLRASRPGPPSNPLRV
jgi:hypothetical protein